MKIHDAPACAKCGATVLGLKFECRRGCPLGHSRRWSDRPDRRLLQMPQDGVRAVPPAEQGRI